MNLFRTVQLFFCTMLLVPGCAGREPFPPLNTVEYVDLRRYSGRWYEIARYPHWFEQGCSAVTADYSLLEDGTLRVFNQCILADKGGKAKQAVGRAKVVDPVANARLKVSFFRPFYGDYWILQLDPEYRYAVVGAPSRKYLWILARSPRLEPELLRQLMEETRRLGFDPGLLILTDQSINSPPH
jgi:apolipoprotein D and lipocalin family protein